MISQKYKFIFVGIPKCAGTSVRRIVRPYSEIKNFQTIYKDCCGDGLGRTIFKKLFKPQNYFKTIVTNPEQHMKLVSELTQPDFFMFTFTRNPYARTVSLWKYLKPKMPFSEFIDWLELDSIKSFHDLAHIKPCSFYVNLYQNAFSENYFIGQLESIDNEFAEICQRIGLPELNVPKVNQTNHLSYQNYYSEELIHKVSQIYAEDLELFNYKF